MPETSLHSDEVDWYQTYEEKILIVVMRGHSYFEDCDHSHDMRMAVKFETSHKRS